MASLFRGFVVVILSLLACGVVHGQLSPTFYAKTCPSVQTIVRSVMTQAVRKEPRMGASIIRLFFHDCFVNGCDASILLDGTTNLKSEKNAIPNQNSIRGYEVIDAIKSRLEAACRATVSCADIVALAACDAVNLLGGPTWAVPLGRRDARSANEGEANNLPSPFDNLATLISKFGANGLSARDMTALSGAHTVGMSFCSLAATTPASCQAGLAPLDPTTPNLFDNSFYKNLVARRGLLRSDQELFNGGSQDSLVRNYSANGALFARDFAAAMVRMGNISPLTGRNGEIRLNCRRVN